MELKRKAVIGVCENRWVSETTDNSVKGLLLFFGPTKWCFRLALLFLGLRSSWMPNQQIIKWSDNGRIPLDKSAVIARKSEKFTDVFGALRNRPRL